MPKTITASVTSNNCSDLLRTTVHEAIRERALKAVLPVVLSCVIAVSTVLTGCSASKIDDDTTQITQYTTQQTTAHLGGGTFKDGEWHLDLTASNNPKMYLDKNYVDREPWSDWAHYAPLVDKTNQIIAGKKTDYDKALAIATYVSTSKKYNDTSRVSVANNGGTVIEVYNASEGVCVDAAVLTVAMLRLANIPARTITPNAFAHEYAEAYVNGKWIGIDDMFGSPLQFGMTLTDITSTFVHWGVVPSYNVEDIYPWSPSPPTILTNIYLSYTELIPTDNSGQITYPSSSKAVYADTSGHNLSYSQQNYPNDIYEAPISITFMANDLSNSSPYYSTVIPPQATYLPLGNSAELVGWGTDTSNMQLYPCYPKYDGYITTSLPAGNYRVEYGWEASFTAYADITIKQGQNFTLTESMFKKVDGISDSDFNITMRILFNGNP